MHFCFYYVFTKYLESNYIKMLSFASEYKNETPLQNNLIQHVFGGSQHRAGQLMCPVRIIISAKASKNMREIFYGFITRKKMVSFCLKKISGRTIIGHHMIIYSKTRKL
jgi:hypothetical protein